MSHMQSTFGCLFGLNDIMLSYRDLQKPRANPYVRHVLRSARARARGLPNLVVRAFLAAPRARGPSALITHLLLWCDAFQGTDAYAALDRHQSVEVDRLAGMLGAVANVPTGPLPRLDARAPRGVPPRPGGVRRVHDGAGLLCSRCKLVRYCDRECQMEAWKAGHKHVCFAVGDVTGANVQIYKCAFLTVPPVIVRKSFHRVQDS
ncbi:hypothetical protein PHLGIDRAFT_117733 [Phlebiopsis gigantea 11061_1 CR5-6]|uniref:MYND-type domain-containing protein n=1 Tax=Phlebiopsis gigantea (strain 11061_1 CR5-6) TaxID=745531 RepID=A0A0C3PMK4_PHLG1|nr:hypothetical protein PHLGIDRAFT_117733 [Phlebiopsis gigantea 11061_1 CR5-6]